MYKPARVSQFITTALHMKLTRTLINGREQEQYINADRPNLRGAFKQKGSAQLSANGLYVVGDKITYSTYYKADIAHGDRLIINGVTYTINGTPDNTEGRGRYMVCNLERVAGDGE